MKKDIQLSERLKRRDPVTPRNLPQIKKPLEGYSLFREAYKDKRPQYDGILDLGIHRQSLTYRLQQTYGKTPRLGKYSRDITPVNKQKSSRNSSTEKTKAKQILPLIGVSYNKRCITTNEDEVSIERGRYSTPVTHRLDTRETKTLVTEETVVQEVIKNKRTKKRKTNSQESYSYRGGKKLEAIQPLTSEELRSIFDKFRARLSQVNRTIDLSNNEDPSGN